MSNKNNNATGKGMGKALRKTQNPGQRHSFHYAAVDKNNVCRMLENTILSTHQNESSSSRRIVEKTRTINSGRLIGSGTGQANGQTTDDPIRCVVN